MFGWKYSVFARQLCLTTFADNLFTSHTNYKCCVQYKYSKCPVHLTEKNRKGVDKYNCKEKTGAHQHGALLVYQCVWVRNSRISTYSSIATTRFWAYFYTTAFSHTSFITGTFDRFILKQCNINPHRFRTMLLCPINTSWFLIVCISKL